MRRQLGLLGLVLAACVGPPPPSPVLSPSTPKPAPPSPSASPEGWRSSVPKPGAPAELVYPTPESEKLENGLTLLVVSRPARVTSLSVVVRHGQSSVPKGKSGLAALTARMLTEGTKRRSAGELAEAAESLGSTLDHDAGRDYSEIGLSTLSADVEQGLALLAEVATRPAFSPRELERVKREWLDGLTAERQAPDRLASLAGLRLLYGEPHGAPVGGSIPDVKKLTAKDLSDFHAAHWVPASSALVVVGDVTLAGIRAAAAKAFGSWQHKAPPAEAESPAPNVPEKTRVVMVHRADAVQSALFVAQPFPKRAAPGHESRQLLNTLLGGLFTSRINLNLREKNAFTYGARSDAIATRLWGALVVATRVETGVTAPAFTELVKELRRARDPSQGAPIGDEEVARSRADIVSSLGAHLVEVDRVAKDVGTLFAQGMPPSYHGELGKVLAALTKADVAKEAARIDERRLVVVIVGDKRSVQPALEAAGFGVVEASADLTQ